MEDISRELEREIARSKPKPYKQNKETRILIVDDFGEMKSGDYLKTLIRILSIVSIICFAAAALYYYLYTGLYRDADLIEEKLISTEKKLNELIQEREVLMARLVMSGKDPVIEKKNEKQDKPIIAKVEEKKPLILKNEPIRAIPSEPEDEDEIDKSLMVGQEKNMIKSTLNMMSESAETVTETETPRVINKTVSIEKFVVTKDGRNGNLLVRFDIRNISKKSGDVSGRIFTILKPDNSLEDQWLVVPTAALKDGIPSEYKKGQYFSITHFKPVKFRIKNQADPNFFKTASIFIFNEQADLIFEQLITITDAD
jgi:hypothetical protein